MGEKYDFPTSLPGEAYEAVDGENEYKPVVPHTESIPEFTIKAIIFGTIVGVLFGAANAYLGLKVGLTVSASIPAAVMGVAFFRLIRRGTILETNMVQTIGSAGESLAAGVIFTLPVLYLWGYTPGFWPIFPLALLGGLLGVFCMIPLRRFLIVKEHGRLIYPEGTACAEVLTASQKAGPQAKLLFFGMGVGLIYAVLYRFFHLFSEEPDVILNKGGFRTSFGGDATPELLGVGFIIGPKVSAVMLAGGAIGWLVIIPLIYLFGGDNVIAPESKAVISEMGSFKVWSRYLRYIGAGAVAFGGLFTLIKSFPVIVNSFRLGIKAVLGEKSENKNDKRTQIDIAFLYVGIAFLLIALFAMFLPLKVVGGNIGFFGAVAVVVFGFFFVTVSSRIVGLLGSSSNPISGMTIATVLICSIIFGASGGESARVLVLTIGALVCIAAAIAGDTSQDLKTGHLVGATPSKQQWGEVIGVICAAIAMSSVLALFKDDIVSGAFKAPQANLIKLVIDGVLSNSLPWALVFIGMAMAFCVEIMGLPTLAFAVGLYLPIHLAVPIMVGGLIRLFVEKRYRVKSELEKMREKGVLYSSGLIAGAALVGVIAAAINLKWAFVFHIFEEASSSEWLAPLVAFSILAATLLTVVMYKRAKN